MKNVIFDLDGTLIDPKEGITGSIRYALKKLGKKVPTVDELLWCIGPPLYDSFPVLTGIDDRKYTYRAVDLYREYYNEKGVYQFVLYDGIEQVLSELYKRGHKLFIATSKPRIMAEKIINHLGFTSYFSNVYGCELDGTRSNKAELLEYLLGREKISSEDSFMIGDRKHDMIGAGANSICSCGAAYGYGSVEELKDAGANCIAECPMDILKLKILENE